MENQKVNNTIVIALGMIVVCNSSQCNNNIVQIGDSQSTNITLVTKFNVLVIFFQQTF